MKTRGRTNGLTRIVTRKTTSVTRTYEMGVSPEMFEKYCSTCKWPYPREAFDVSNDRPSKLQPQCKQCRDEWALSDAGLWSACRCALQRVDPESYPLWNEQIFLGKLEACGRVCTYCQNGFGAYQLSGLRLDRIDSSCPRHTPENTVMCCYPCNMVKSSSSPLAWKVVLEELKKQFFGMPIQWESYDPKRFSRHVPRSTYRLRIKPRQLDLVKS